VVLGLQHRSRLLAPVEAVASTLTRLVGELVRSGAWPSARPCAPDPGRATTAGADPGPACG